MVTCDGKKGCKDPAIGTVDVGGKTVALCYGCGVDATYAAAAKGQTLNVEPLEAPAPRKALTANELFGW